MKFSELPLDQQNCCKIKIANLHNHCINTRYEILLYNKLGTRYFHACRKQEAWYDTKGNYMPFGGGSSWYVHYGKVAFSTKKIMGIIVAEPALGQRFAKSSNGTEIPANVKTKKEVIAIAKAIGLFDI